MTVLSDLLEPGRYLAYTTRLGDRVYAFNWALYVGPLETDEPADDNEVLHELLFLSIKFPSNVGLAGPDERLRARLICHEDLRPVRYRVMSRFSVNEINFGKTVELTLPDGSCERLTPDPFEAVVGENLGQLALFLKLRGTPSDEPGVSTLFALGTADTIRYEVSPPDELGVFETGIRERLQFDADGWLVRYESIDHGLISERSEEALPAWVDDDIRERPLAYAAPGDPRIAFEDVAIPTAHVVIGTTITIPREPSRHRLAIFLGGSGAHDRHGIAGSIDLGTHELLDQLTAEAGWMCMRSDSRGAGSTGLGDDFLELGFADVVDDAAAVLRYAVERDDVDRQRIALIGHSQGGLVAIELAKRHPDIAAIVLLATPGRPLEQVLTDQLTVQATWLGQTPDQLDAQIQDLREMVELVRSGTEWTPEKVPPRLYVYKRWSSWYADLVNYDPAIELSQVRCPVLVCQGGKDFQVSATSDARRLASLASEAGLDVELKVFDELDHLLKPVTGEPHIRHYYDRERSVPHEVVARIAAFLAAHT